MKRKRDGIITVEAVFVMPIVIGVIFLLYSIIVTQYNNIVFQTTAIQITNRIGANWNQIVGEHTILTEDMNTTLIFEDQTSEKVGRTGKNVITSANYADNDPYADILQLLGVGKKERMEAIQSYYEYMMLQSYNEDRFDFLQMNISGRNDMNFNVLELIFGGTFEVSVENNYSNGLIEIVNGLGFHLNNRNVATVKASFNNPVEFVRNVSFAKEMIEEVKEKKGEEKNSED